MIKNVKDDIAEAKKTFIDEGIVEKKLQDGNYKTNYWNNNVKECKSIKVLDKKFLLIEITNSEGTGDQFCIVDEANLSEKVLNYIKAFETDYTEDELVHDIINKDEDTMENDQEIQNLKGLI